MFRSEWCQPGSKKRLSVLFQGEGFPRLEAHGGGAQGEALYLLRWQRLENIHLSEKAFKLLYRRVLEPGVNLTSARAASAHYRGEPGAAH